MFEALGGWALTDHVQVSGLGDHGVGVDLAHVVALVLCLDVPDVEAPGVVAVVDDVEPGDMIGQRDVKLREDWLRALTWVSW